MSNEQINKAFGQFINKEVYDRAAVTGSKKFGIDKSTINNMIEIFQGDPIDACLLLMVWIKRQEARREITQQFSRSIINDLADIYNRFKSAPILLEQAVRKYLILVKWIFESDISNINNIDEFIKQAGGRQR